MGKVRIGIIGCGNIAQNAHIPAYLKNADCELVGVCDTNLARAKGVAEKYGLKHAVAGAAELVAIKDIDAVSVCTWNNGHKDAVVAAAKAGKHILCEKPMAMCVGEALEMEKAVKDAGVTFMMGFVNRYRNDVRALKGVIDAGRMGDIYLGKATLLRRRGTPLGWFTDKGKSGGGPVIDLGVHTIDLTWYLMGRPEPISVSATAYYRFGDYKTKGVSRWVAYDTDDLKYDVEDSANGMIRFAGGATMMFEVSYALNGNADGKIHSVVYGDKAGFDLEARTIYGEEGGYLSDTRQAADAGDIFGNEIRHFLDCALGSVRPESPIGDGIRVQRMLDGIYASAKAGAEVRV